MKKFEYDTDVKKVMDEVTETGRIMTFEEALTLIWRFEAKEDKLMAIENVLTSIPEEYCTPKVKEDIELALRIIKG